MDLDVGRPAAAARPILVAEALAQCASSRSPSANRFGRGPTIRHQMQQIGATHLGEAELPRSRPVSASLRPTPRVRSQAASISSNCLKIGFIERHIVEAPILEPLLALFDEIEELRNECRRCDCHLEPDLQHRPDRWMGFEKGEDFGILEISCLGATV